MEPVQRAPIRRQFLRPIPYSEETSSITRLDVQAKPSHDVTFMPTTPLPVAVAEPPLLTPPVTPSPIQVSPQGKQKSRRKKRLPLWFAICSVITVLTLVFLSQGNGAVGAWMADTLRAVIGPTATAQIESWYLGLTNTSSQLQYQLSDKKVAAPWKISTAVPSPSPTPPPSATVSPMTFTAMDPVISPALPGEGTWNTLSQAPAPYNYLPLDARTFIRPDAAHPYAIVTLLQFDSRFTLLHIVGGTIEPGGPRGVHGPGAIPAADLKGNALLAAFNGGFKYSDGQYGLMTNGVLYVPPQHGAATIAITKEGKLVLGAWGVDPLLNSQNSDLVAWRQNAALLIDKGVINPLTQDGAAWGGTILNSAYTWRSAIGITADGSLLYAAGNALTALTLGNALKAAGAVMAMQTDINPFWVRAFLYDRNQNGPLNIVKLHPQMQGTGNEYLYGAQRDFFYLTRFAPATAPK
ncbi:MAG TPA: phosphodiester glycosidase family protein [Ktedonosporobacter sp.]|nr:phosphodiester glycosidase family protein [Ktedonosporobacter sp.]